MKPPLLLIAFTVLFSFTSLSTAILYFSEPISWDCPDYTTEACLNHCGCALCDTCISVSFECQNKLLANCDTRNNVLFTALILELTVTVSCLIVWTIYLRK